MPPPLAAGGLLRRLGRAALRCGSGGAVYGAPLESSGRRCRRCDAVARPARCAPLEVATPCAEAAASATCGAPLGGGAHGRAHATVAAACGSGERGARSIIIARGEAADLRGGGEGGVRPAQAQDDAATDCSVALRSSCCSRTHRASRRGVGRGGAPAVAAGPLIDGAPFHRPLCLSVRSRMDQPHHESRIGFVSGRALRHVPVHTLLRLPAACVTRVCQSILV